MKRAIYNIDGRAHIMLPAYKDGARDSSLSDDEFFAYAIKRSLPKDISYDVIDDEDSATQVFLSDRTFRDAWECLGGELTCNMTRARVIHMDAIRGVRNAELAALDLPYMRAIEAGDTEAQVAIAAKKQTLRDIPQTFNLTDARTPGRLKVLWPEELEKPS